MTTAAREAWTLMTGLFSFCNGQMSEEVDIMHRATWRVRGGNAARTAGGVNARYVDGTSRPGWEARKIGGWDMGAVGRKLEREERGEKDEHGISSGLNW
ncbi:hypothetical protein BDZ85DRAFT_100273 [Elsinoe ampelina]|uniref:Uncharacterized protein n=1 Tax=Elsinoe ampelina TaxID=302913 RepID=A0A6A6GF16_9PEZI|nr:hypothetical protein BDZ85DRAFT_100273 [Elsinoe ampelina]